ncbi:PREDICTED: uncharacterized protein LOC106314739 [Brassica oleracea var. oleracea]|uniref:uncharacterized protein LOC106314739 n=1 Tax=Brassica oleracea var. oleracea TaxID=109376 RepID=UPI0006A7199D|nr:PREDICTED: uncharacterized protein LOC106314739 [Brassica oleracea var. oleracea]
MDDDEPIDGFISKISELASESYVLGKKYEEKDLVKKLLRWLPPRFEAYKAVHDLEKFDRLANTQKSIAFKADANEGDKVSKIEETLGLMAQNFNKFVKHMEKGYGHFRNECPLAKRKELKCIECKGIGHNRSECPNTLKKDKSLVCFSDTESDSDSGDEEMHLNFIALIGQEDDKKSENLAELSDQEEDDGLNQELEIEYKTFFDKFAELSHENLQLLNNKAMLKAQVNILELEQSSLQTPAPSILKESDQEILALKRAMTEQERVHKQFEVKVNQLSELLAKEVDKSKCDLYPNYKELSQVVIPHKSIEPHTESEQEFVCNFATLRGENDVISNVAFTSAKIHNQVETPWYFDSGFSKHMIGNQDFIEKLEHIKGGKVTFGDGGQGKIRGVGVMERADLPRLINVYFVDGLKANLISVSQLCDDGLEVFFNKFVRGVPDLENQTDIVCGACCQGKQIKIQHKQITEIHSKRILELVHMDLMGPITPESIAGKRYIFVLVDDFSRYTWVDFLRNKSDALQSFRILALQLKQEKGGIIQNNSDHGGESQNEQFDRFCQRQGIRHQYAAPRTPQQNGVVERKNRTLQDMARAMLCGNSALSGFWAEAVSTACYVINRVYVRPKTKTTPYEIFKGKTPNLSHMHVFGCLCYILNDKDHLVKFDAKSDVGMFLGYSSNSSSYRVFNKRTKFVSDNVNVVFDDNVGFYQARVTQTIDCVTPTIATPIEAHVKYECQEEVEQDAILVDLDQGRVHKNHSAADVIGGVFDERVTRKKQIDFNEMVKLVCFMAKMNTVECLVSLIEPKNIQEALEDEY